MPIENPEIVTGNYDDILKEVLARIPVHNPEWTNFNNSDPGVTILQLFAFMADSLNYRINQIPLRNYKKFLALLGIPLKAAEPFKSIVTFQSSPAYIDTVTIKKGIELFSGQVPFLTQDGLDVLPLESRLYYKAPLPEGEIEDAQATYNALYPDMVEDPEKLPVFYKTEQFLPPSRGTYIPALDMINSTVDGTLWVALLAFKDNVIEATRSAIANKVLSLGILPSIRNDVKNGNKGKILKPESETPPSLQCGLHFFIPRRETYAQNQERIAHYNPLEARSTGDLISEPGIVQLLLPDYDDLFLWKDLQPFDPGSADFPPYIEEMDIAQRIITWIRIKPAGSIDPGTNTDFKFSWIGINAARTQQGTRIIAENLGQGTGEPDQMITLVNKPVITNTLELTVNGEPWSQVNDIMDADPEVAVYNPFHEPEVKETLNNKVYMADRESGRIRFGDGLHGMRPPEGAFIQASYHYGGGSQGNVGIGAINKGSDLPIGVKVTNPIPSWGGSDGESVVDGVRRIPGFIRHRERLVSKSDFLEITGQTPGIELGRVETLPLFHPDFPDQKFKGVVTLLVIPKKDPVYPDTPEPDKFFLQKVCDFINPRRLITTEIYIRGPEYKPLWIGAGIDVAPGRSIAPVLQAVKEEIKQFLSPLVGGFNKKGWELEKTVHPGELTVVVARVDGVVKVNNIMLVEHKEPPEEKTEIPLTGLQLPRIMGITVAPGEVMVIEGMEEAAPAEDVELPPTDVVPMPKVPPECEC